MRIRGSAVVVYGVVFVAFVDTFAMLPTVGPYAHDLGARALGVGIAVGAYSVTNLVLNVVGGAMLDRVGRRRLLLAGLVIAAASMGAYAVAETPAALVAARLLHGVGGGILLPAVFTVVGDLAPQGGRGRAMGRAGAVIGAAAVIAPGLAGALRQAAGFDAVFAAVAVCMAVGAVVVAVALPETAGPRVAERRGGTWSGLLRRPALRASFGGVFAFTFAVGTLAAFLPLHVEGIGQRPATTGALFTGFAAVAAVVMLSRLAMTVDRHGVGPPAASGLLVIAVALGLLATAPPMGATVASALLFGLGYGLVFPATAGVVSAVTEAGERGRAYGLYNVFFSLGLAIGPTAGGLAATAGAPPFAPAVAVAMAGALALTLWRRAVGVLPAAS